MTNTLFGREERSELEPATGFRWPEGLRCPRCGSTELKTFWQRFRDDSWHVRLECGRAACRAFVRYLKQEPDQPEYRHQARRADAHAAELKSPPASFWWIGHYRQADGLWRPVALCRTLAGCWDALLTCPGEGDRLAIPCRPPELPEGGYRDN